MSRVYYICYLQTSAQSPFFVAYYNNLTDFCGKNNNTLLLTGDFNLNMLAKGKLCFQTLWDSISSKCLLSFILIPNCIEAHSFKVN